MKESLSYRDVYCKVTYISVCFTILYTAFDSLRVIVSQTYR